MAGVSLIIARSSMGNDWAPAGMQLTFEPARIDASHSCLIFVHGYLSKRGPDRVAQYL